MSNSINIITDPEGVLWFKSYLESKHFENIHIPEDKFSPYDIEADKDGKHYIFEIKNRSCTSTTWNDSIIESTKFNVLHHLKGEKYVVNLFTDCFHIHNLESEHEEQHHMCQKTNNWNRNKVHKILISYKNTQQSKREYK